MNHHQGMLSKSGTSTTSSSTASISTSTSVSCHPSSTLTNVGGVSTNQTSLSSGSAVYSTNPISYNPISNLALQYYSRNATNKNVVTVLIEVPSDCHVPGGLETLLSSSSSGKKKNTSGGGSVVSSLSKWKHVAKSQLEKVTLRGNMDTLMSVGAYHRCLQTGEWLCAGMTNWTSYTDRTFQIPLLLETNTNYEFQLHYKVDYSKNNVSALFGKRSHHVGTTTNPFVITAFGQHSLPLYNPHITTTDNTNNTNQCCLKVTILPNLKYPPNNNDIGMSSSKMDSVSLLTDPNDAGMNNQRCFPVLSQTYVVGSDVVATERAMESTVVLPMATAMSYVMAHAMKVSQSYYSQVVQSIQPVYNAVQARRMGHAHVRFGLLEHPSNNLKVYWQTPKDIFEVPLHLQQRKVEFYPPLHTDPTTLLPGTTLHHKHYLGSIRIQLTQHPDLADITNSAMSLDTTHISTPGTTTGSTKTTIWEAKLNLEDYIEDSSSIITNNSASPPTTYSLPLTCTSPNHPHNNNNNNHNKLIYFQLTVDTLLHMTTADDEVPTNNIPPSCHGGLLQLTNTNWPFSDLYPHLEPTNHTTTNDRRKRQLQTMGSFLSHHYLDPFVQIVCKIDEALLRERRDAYYHALLHPETYNDTDEPIFKRKQPRPFRPSSSRLDALLTGIGFNVHVQSLTIQTIDPTNPSNLIPVADACVNITCGAPADHCRGFSSSNHHNTANTTTYSTKNSANVGGIPAVPTASTTHFKVPSGGLRRLIRAKESLEQRLNQSIQSLINSVGQKFASTSSRHLCTDGNAIGQLLKSCQEQAQYLHRLTWDIAVRKSNVFAQASTIAITAYLSHVTKTSTDNDKAQLYAKHGFLLVFKGLLSTAGNELGMIEDASVGIAMLRNLHITLCPDTITMKQYLTSNKKRNNNVNPILPIPESPHLRWLHLTTEYDTTTNQTKFMVYVGLDVTYYQNRLPNALKNNVAVQLFPILYQMGVDIRQWGANTIKNTTQKKNVSTNFSRSISTSTNATNHDDPNSLDRSHSSNNNPGVLDDDDDDDEEESGADLAANNDVLVQLNMEAFWKMNAYAHNSLSPVEKFPFERKASDPPPSIHPQLVDLYELIRFSAGKMEHDILDEAASLAVQLGGAGAIFCKSGKDRTAMQVTYQQAQHLCQNTNCADDLLSSYATTMRIYGTRLPICEKNVGQSLFAFNSLQSKFMPDVLKPPPRTLAGFLKGGRVFSREGAIET